MDFQHGKLFVGGISWQTNEKTLSRHFEKYGEVVDCVVMREKITGDARGFGFVVFADASAAEKALQDEHVILGRMVDVKKAIPKAGEEHLHLHQHQHQSEIPFRTKKIFVGGLSYSLTEEALKSYFQKFGNITDARIMYDHLNQRPRGFGFVTFDSEVAVENVMQKSFHELNYKIVEVKRAVPPNDRSNELNHSERDDELVEVNRGVPTGGSRNVNGNNNSNLTLRITSEQASGFGPNRHGCFLGYALVHPGYSLVPVSGYVNSAAYQNEYFGAGYGIPIEPPRSP